MGQSDRVGFGWQLRDRLLRCGLADIYSFEGCTKEEVEEVKTRLKIDFVPQIYREVLEVMGRNCGSLFQGSTYHYIAVLSLREETHHAFEQMGVEFRFPEDAIIFLDHGGYAQWYFHTKEHDDDPPVYLYEEIKEYARQITDHLSTFYDETVNEMAPHCS